MKKFTCFFFLFTLLFCFNGKAQNISAGSDHSFAICESGSSMGWGNNGYFELGNGSSSESIEPILVNGLTNITSVSLGENHSLFLKNNGTVLVCGRNYSGELGIGTDAFAMEPIQISNLTGIVAISAGKDHSLFLKNDGTVWGTGNNFNGELGDSTFDYTTIPVQISNLTQIIAISAGYENSLFLKSDGTVWACGRNDFGQLGDGTNISKHYIFKIVGLNNIIAISATGYHSLFLKNDSTVWACGNNWAGQLGDGSNSDKYFPFLISGLSEICAISAGKDHSLFLNKTGLVWACGANFFGQLGLGNFQNKNLPQQLLEISGITEISGGYYHSLFLKKDGSVWACGSNFSGQLGNEVAGFKSDKPMLTASLCIVKGTKGILGSVFLDINKSCNQDSSENGLLKRIITLNPGNLTLQTNGSGWWHINSLPPGNYTITADTSGKWRGTCPSTQSFTVTNSDSLTIAPNFGFVSTEPCAEPNVSIAMPRMRPGFSNQYIYVNACNDYLATGTLNNAYADIVLDDLLTVDAASLGYTPLGNNTYRFQLDTLNPGQCVNFSISTTLNTAAVLGQTLCLQANLFPADSCVFDTIATPAPADFTPCTLPWDRSSLKVEGWCQNDSVYFTVTNHGSQDMDCYSPVRIYIDGNYISLDSVLLISGQTATFAFAGDGHTWRLEADQHPLHPGNSHPNATVELCGDANNWTPGLVNVLPQDDADPVIDIFCGQVTGSYDPNDKRGFPLGTGTQHFILPNGQINYVIRFQNTGTDTAFTVVIRDTLDTDLNIFSVQSGAASHAYTFKMYGPRVLEWTFNNILLADSNTNEAASHGFISFTVDQLKNLPDGTPINNTAGIYFDFNAPIITNTSKHVVHRNVQWMVGKKDDRLLSKDDRLNVLPNPSNGNFKLSYNSTAFGDVKMEVYNILGAKMYESKANKNDITFNAAINLQEVPKGVYTLIVSDSKGTYRGKIVLQ